MSRGRSALHAARRARLRWPAALLAALPAVCGAHAGSTAYFQLEVDGRALQWRADYALQDLDDAFGIDADDDGRITWGEVQAAMPALDGYLLGKLSVSDAGQPCPLTVAAAPAIVDHADGPYAVFRLQAHCAAPPRALQIVDRALFEFDANHRALARLTTDGREASTVFSPQHEDWQPAATGSAAHTVLAYGREGLHHVWSGLDHLLFLAGLFLPVALRRESGGWRPVASRRVALLDAARLITAFTVAHAVTLCLSALQVISLPVRLVESGVAFSVLFAGLNNLRPVAGPRALFVLAWCFGLIHGAAIAGALQDLGLPAGRRLSALLGFNLGVECAQLALVAAVLPLAYRFRNWDGYRRWVLGPGSLAVTLAGLWWLADRALGLGLPSLG